MVQLFADLGDSIAIVGTQWGDEGKGKLVDALSQRFDIVCRSAGGSNAGHTIVTDGKKFIFRLLPSGMLHPQTIGVVGNGTVVSISDLVQEIKELESSGLEIRSRIKLSLQAHVIFDYHKKIDAELEKRKGDKKIGTTCRGIGPAYTDKISRIGIRYEDILDEELLLEKMIQNCAIHNKNLGLHLNPKEEYEIVMENRKIIISFLTDTRKFLNNALKTGKKIMFEGAQGFFLDIDHGTYPFVTSSSTGLGGVCTGLGIAPQKISGVIGIMKSYITRVGSGPFPSELKDTLGDTIRKQGNEYGSVTGRPRRIGWFDAVVVRNAIESNGIDAINLTKLDVLSGLLEIKVAVRYLLDGTELFTVPTTRKANLNLQVEYKTFPGWKENLKGISKFEDLPINAQKYVLELEKLIQTPIRAIGTGQDRNDLIFR
jgi:adenylosuccinate synthase